MKKEHDGGERVTLQDFVHSYVSTSLRLLAERNDPIVLGDWEKSLRKRVSRDTGLSEEQVLYLHHPFHWTFFLNEHGKDSPLELMPGEGLDSNIYVKLKEKATPNLVETLANKVYENYGKVYLPARILMANIPLQ